MIIIILFTMDLSIIIMILNLIELIIERKVKWRFRIYVTFRILTHIVKIEIVWSQPILQYPTSYILHWYFTRQSQFSWYGLKWCNYYKLDPKIQFKWLWSSFSYYPFAHKNFSHLHIFHILPRFSFLHTTLVLQYRIKIS